MPYPEYLGWQEFYDIEPWGLSVQDAAQAHIAVTLANVNRDSKQRPDAYRLDEFLLFSTRKTAVAGPVLLSNADAQTDSMIEAMFGGKAVRA